MLRWWLVQIAAGVVIIGLYRYQRWSVRRWNQRARIKLDEGFGIPERRAHS